MLLLGIKTLADISLKVHHQHAKALTLNLQNIQLYSHSGVDDFNRHMILHSILVMLSSLYYQYIILGQGIHRTPINMQASHFNHAM